MPLLLQQAAPCLGVWKIEESEEELLALLAHPEAYLPQLARWQSAARRKEWLACRVLLKTLTGEELPVAYRENGAPYLPGSSWHLSFSHTQGYAAALLQPHPAAGIDIEYRSERVYKIRRRFLAPEEEFSGNAGENPHSREETDYLLIGWCAKETLFKMIGEEKVDFIRHLHLRPFTLASQGYLYAYETRTPRSASFRLGYRVFSDFILTWSSDE